MNIYDGVLLRMCIVNYLKMNSLTSCFYFVVKILEFCEDSVF